MAERISTLVMFGATGDLARRMLLPALVSSASGYLVFAAWIVIWLWHRRSQTLSAAVAAPSEAQAQ